MTRDFPKIVAQEPDIDVCLRYSRYPFSEGGDKYTMIFIRVGCISNRDGEVHWEEYEVSEREFKRFNYDKIISMLIDRLHKSLNENR